MKNIKRTEKELQEHLLFSILNSSSIEKNSEDISKNFDLLLKENYKRLLPLEWIEELSSIQSSLGIDYLYEFLSEYQLPSDKKTLVCLKEATRYKNNLNKATEEDFQTIRKLNKNALDFFFSKTTKDHE